MSEHTDTNLLILVYYVSSCVANLHVRGEAGGAGNVL